MHRSLPTFVDAAERVAVRLERREGRPPGILVAAVELTFMMRRRVHGGVEHAREVGVERGSETGSLLGPVVGPLRRLKNPSPFLV